MKQVRLVADDTDARPHEPLERSALARSWAAPWAGVGLYALLFFAAGLIGYIPSNRPYGFAIVWLANGVLISGLIAARKRSVRLGIVVVSLIVAIANSIVHGRPVWMAVLFALSNTAEAVAGAALVLRASRGFPTVAHVRGATLVVGLPIGVSAALASAVSVILLALGRFHCTFWVFWAGSSVGIAVVLPAFLAFREPTLSVRRRGHRAIEAIALAGVHLFALAVIARGGGTLGAGPFILLPPLLWAALNFGPRGAALSGVAAAIGVLLAARARSSSGMGSPTGVLELQLVLALLLSTALVVAAAFEERRRAAAKLRDGRDLLEAFLVHSPSGMFIKDDRHRVVALSRVFEAIVGTPCGAMLGRTVAEILPGDVGERLLLAESEVLASGNAAQQTVQIGERTLLTTVFTVPRLGRKPFLGGFAIDVTDRVRAESATRALAARLQAIREEEKTRIARNLHDELGQLLTGLKMDLRWVERRLGELAPAEPVNAVLDHVVGASALVDQTVASVQRIAADLRPSVLDKLGLGAALRHEARRFHERTGIPCDVLLASLPDLQEQAATALYRIGQEALTNVARHAGASRVAVSLAADPQSVTLRVEDDGRGIADVSIGPQALGLLGMKERATMLGGDVAFERGRERGTIVTLRVPVARVVSAGARAST